MNSKLKTPDKSIKSASIVLRIFLILLVAIILLGIGYCGFRVHELSNKQEGIKKDYMVVNSVSFGLLSVDEWRDNIVAASRARIQNYQITQEQNRDLEKQIAHILDDVVHKTVTNIQKPSKNLGEKLKKLAFNTLINEDKLRSEIPGYSRLIVKEINKPESYNRLKHIALIQLDSIGNQTYDLSKNSEKILLDSIFKKYSVTDKPAFETQSIADLDHIRRQTYYWAFAMLGGVILIMTGWWFMRNVPDVHTPLYVMSIFSALILMAVGLTSSIIQIDARISAMDFNLMGQDVGFKNQVLFYQSKSIIDVIRVLIRTGNVDTVIVGSMILIFCILFPVVKMLTTGVYMLEKRRWARNKIIHLFAFTSGKWNMADVLVLAILMTYIGFNGIVNSTLSDLNINNGTITSQTTNNTSLQPGYIIFLGFVIYSFALSYILKNVSHLRHIIVLDKKEIKVA